MHSYPPYGTGELVGRVIHATVLSNTEIHDLEGATVHGTCSGLGDYSSSTYRAYGYHCRVENYIHL